MQGDPASALGFLAHETLKIDLRIVPDPHLTTGQCEANSRESLTTLDIGTSRYPDVFCEQFPAWYQF